jgi:gliding motility-associated-like protein
MQNRFLHLPRTFAVLSVYLLSVLTANAQQGAFNFTPPQPQPLGIGVGSNCFGAVSNGVPPTVTPVNPGAVITLSQFSPANPYGFTDQHPLGTSLNVLWDVADNLGNTATFNFGVIMVDKTPPEFDSVATPPELLVNSLAQVPPLGPIPINDNCSGFTSPPTQNFSQTMPPPPCQAGSFTRTWTATDVAGNFAIYTQYITVYRDSLLPVITVPPVNGSAPCDLLPGAYTNWLAAQMAAFTATDASGIASYTNSAPPPPVPCPGSGQVTVTFRATDNCGFTATRMATFTTFDTTPPVVVVEPKDTVAYCGNHTARLAEFIQTRGYSQVVDACSPSLTWQMEVNGVVRDSAQIAAILQDSIVNSVCGVKLIGGQVWSKVRGYVRVDFSARDICQNEVFVGQGVFGVIDTTPPVITGPALTTESCGGTNDQTALTLWINARGNATATDQCSSTSWTNFSYTTSDGQSGTGNFVTGPFPTVQSNNCNWFTDVTFRATDQCGNSATRTQRFQLSDNIAPIIGGFPDTTVVYCPTALPATFNATVTDNCSTGLTATYTTQFADTSCVGNYSFKVFWTVTDQCGNTGTKTQIFAIRDTVGPQFLQVPAPVTISCDSVAFAPVPVIGTNVTANDPCGAMQGITMTTTNNKNPNPNACGHYNYEITHRFTATDQCGNTRTAQQVVSVRDTRGPVSAIPLPDTIVFCQNLPIVAAIPPAMDNCSPVLNPVTQKSQTIIAGICPDSYTIRVTWSAFDVCGNEGTFFRNYLVRDTIRPTISNIPLNVTVECDAIPAAPALGSFITNDNCDAAPSVVFTESELRDPDVNNCNHWSNYQIKREWTVTDACSNARTYTQIISVMDNTPPVFEVKDTVDMPNTPGLCGANVLPPSPLTAYDLCAVLPQSVTLRDTAAITGPPVSDAVCDTVFLAMNSTHLPPLQPVNGNAVLTIFLDNADAEGPDEYFRVYGENGVLLGTTTPVTPTQCGDGVTVFVINQSLINEWLTDGQVTFTLAPNGSDANAINPICPGRQVRSQLNYQYLDPAVGVTIQYKIDNGTVQTYPANSTVFLETGVHTITYIATDCIGNSRTATTVVNISDIEPPIISAPAAQATYVGVNNCEKTWTIPLPGISENCDLSGFLSQSSPPTNTQFMSNANAGFVPKDIVLNIGGLVPNAFANGVLKIRHRGDNNNPGEFFRVFDEQNVPFTTTTLDTTSTPCVSFHETIINVTAAQINAWAADGVASIKLVSNKDAFNFSDFINPCGPLNANGFDGTSAVQATLEYNYAVINYTIKNSQQATVSTGTLNGQQTTAALTAGNYTVQYNTMDVHGNLAQSSFALTVRDTVKPKAVCKNIAIFVSVAGDNPYTLTPAQVNNGSTDNCSGNNLTLQLSQTLFTCSQSGQIVPVTLTVADTSGNSASCTALVNVNTEQITANATANICEGGTAQLFCDPPGNDANYTYVWTNVTGLFSIVQNPVITGAQLSQEGTYVVTVTGPTGCTAIGATQLQLIGLPYQPILSVSQNLLCAGQGFNLTTGAYSGTDVSYQWYRNTIDTLVATTIQPNLILGNPPSGIHQYFVRVVDLNCSSALSAPQTVNVQVPIAATVFNAVQNPCEGDLITFGTNIQGPNVTYAWTGPGAFSRTEQYPVPIAATLTNGGVYQLVVSVNGCPGTPATMTVTVRDRPDMPVITGSSGVCEGSTVMLSAQPAIGNPFLWISPTLDTINTGTMNGLTLNNVTPVDSGSWKVISMLNGCASPASMPHVVAVETYPVVVINASSVICQGSVLQLDANVNQPVTTYSWAGPPSDGFTAFNSPNVMDDTPSTGVYQVTVSTGFGCSGSASIPVEVVGPPVIQSITSNAPPCVDGTTSIQLSPTLVSPAMPQYQYLWTNPNMLTSTEFNLIIPTATTASNGPYTLVVTDQYGCVSQPFSYTVAVQMIPPTPILAQLSAVCEGQSVSVVIANGPYSPSANYIWTAPSVQGLVTNTPSYPTFNASLASGGGYSVAVQVGDCVSVSSATMTLTVNDVPNAPTVTVNSPVCEGDTLRFTATAPPGVMVSQWLWTGPSAFSGNTSTPFRFPALMDHAGEYFISIITNEGCQSPLGEPVKVEVNPLPKKPIIEGVERICMQQADTLTLSVTESSQTSLATYTWYNSAQTPISSSLSPVLKLSDFTGYSAGQNSFYVIATSLEGCSSSKSFVSPPPFFDVIPNIFAKVSSDSLGVCEGPKANLFALPPSVGTGTWSWLSGPPVSISTLALGVAEVDGLVPNNVYQFLWTLSNGACENYSQDTMLISVDAYEQAFAMADTTLCFASEVELYATQGVFNQGYWTQPFGQGQIEPKIQIIDPDSTTTLVTGLGPFNTTQEGFIFIWNIDNRSCPVSTDLVKIRPIYNIPIAQADSVQCKIDGITQLSATSLLPFETGMWSSPNPSIIFNNASSATTVVSNLQQGDNMFIWQTNGGLCLEKSRDTAIVTLELRPEAQNDLVVVPFGNPVAIDLAANDIVPENYIITIEEAPNTGQLVPTGTAGAGLYNYIPDVTFAGEENVLYRVCNIACLTLAPEQACDFAELELQIGTSEGCEIPSVITPNGDNINDQFFIPCLGCADCKNDSELSIFNQWGDLVFHQAPYLQDWEGTYNGQPLPVGSYFYVIKYPTATNISPKTGFILIQR